MRNVVKPLKGKTMNQFVPKLFDVMKGYSKKQFVNDVIAGIIVAIIALPLSIALALASGVGPEQGIYTAIFAGFVISFLGGSRVQIAGPTAAFATIVAGIVAQNGMDGLIVATIMAGIILIIMGFLKFGNLIRFIPYTITTGFTFGIAVTILVGQIKDFLGLDTSAYTGPTIETLDKLNAVFKCINTFNWQALVVGCVSLAILIIWPRFKKLEKIPASLIAVIVSVIMVKLGMQAKTIGDLYTISSKLPGISIPHVNIIMVKNLLPDAFTIAVLAGIESLLSCVVSDGMIGSRHKPNMELVAQGAGNLVSALFGGIPATGAIARTAANVKNGGRTPIAGMVHSVTLLLILVVLMPYAAWIPMPAIAAILFMVAYNMSGWREMISLCKTSPKSDILVLLTTAVLTIVFDLVVAIEVGMVLAMFMFMKKMAETFDINTLSKETENDTYKYLNDDIMVYELAGPMFFGASTTFMDTMKSMNVKSDILILRMRNVPMIDATSLDSLHHVIDYAQRNHIVVLYCELNENTYNTLKHFGCEERMGKHKFFDTMDEAYAYAEKMVETKKEVRKKLKEK